MAKQVANAVTTDLEDERLYGEIGKPFDPYPMYPETPDITEQMPWKWFPTLSSESVRRYFTIERWLTFGTVVFTFSAGILFTVATAKRSNNAGEIVGGVLFLILALTCLYTRVVIGAHKHMRKATCIALGRRNQALALWKSAPGPGYEAKDEFFKNHLFRVLRNGTVEAVVMETTPTDRSSIVNDIDNSNTFVKDSKSVMLNVEDTENQDSSE